MSLSGWCRTASRACFTALLLTAVAVQALAQSSTATLAGTVRDATGVLLNPSRQTTGIVVQDQTSGALPTSLPLTESLQLAWWQLVAVIGGTVVLFAAAYLTFMRQEVRA